MTSFSASIRLITRASCDTDATWSVAVTIALWSGFTEEGLSQLPEPQGFALRVAFGVEAGPPPNVFLVGLAMLNGLADLAEQQPLLVAVDDANWLDQASAQTLSFVARRLQAEGVGLVFAVRESMAELEGLLELPIVGLAPEDARRLLGPIETAAVKDAIGFYSATMMHPEEAQRLIREGVRRGVERRGEIKPYRIAHPVKLQIRFNEIANAEVVAMLPGVERPSGNVIVFQGRDMVEVSRFFEAISNIRVQ